MFQQIQNMAEASTSKKPHSKRRRKPQESIVSSPHTNNGDGIYIKVINHHNTEMFCINHREQRVTFNLKS